MTTNYHLADLLTKLRNGHQARLREVTHPRTKLCQGLLEVLLREGVVANYSQTPGDLRVELKYSANQAPCRAMVCVSRPGRRVYASLETLWGVEQGLGFLVLSTPKGFLSDREARQLQVGGEVLCKVLS